MTRARYCAAGHDLEVGGVNDVRICMNEHWLAAVVCGDTYISPWLVVLRLNLETEASFTLLLFPWSVPADAQRRLRVWLRWRLRS